MSRGLGVLSKASGRKAVDLFDFFTGADRAAEVELPGIGRVTGRGLAGEHYRLFVEEGCDLPQARERLERWSAELPPLLRREPLNIALSRSLAENVGGQASMRKRIISLAEVSHEGAARYAFEHEVAHLLLDGSSVGKAVMSATLITAWSAIAEADSREPYVSQLTAAGIEGMLLHLPCDDEGDAEIVLSLGTGTMTDYAGSSRNLGRRSMEDMAEAIALYLLDRRQGGLPIDAVILDGQACPAEIKDAKNGGRPRFAGLYPRRSKTLDELFAWQLDGDQSWIKAMQPILTASKALRRA